MPRPGTRDRLVIARLDLSDADRLKEELGTLSRQVGGFDIVINNAAIYPSKPFEDFTIEEHQAVQRVNVDAAIVAVQVALPHMRERAWGRIVNVSSITFYGGLPLLAPYVASKGALIGLTRAWAREFGRLRHHGECALARRLPDRCREDSPGSGRLLAVRASTGRR